MLGQRVIRSFIFLLVFSLVAGCFGPPAAFAPSLAHPKTRPVRNFTSFSASLACVDRMIAKTGRGQVLISSSLLQDETDEIDVGADDMLINAINHMNRHSKAYVFLDQARVSGFGQLQLITTRKKDEIDPHYYIRGSISQLDEDVSETDIGVNLRFDQPDAFKSQSFGGGRTLSVVTVDMHLVSYPSRQVLAGGSVANSIVVKQRGFRNSSSGIINITSLAIPITIEHIESRSQAVRALIELGVLELLGRHAGVPYWECLDLDNTDARLRASLETRVALTDIPQAKKKTIKLLNNLGRLSTRSPSKAMLRKAVSEFQTEHGLLADGQITLGLLERLQATYDARTGDKVTVRKLLKPQVDVHGTRKDGDPAPITKGANPKPKPKKEKPVIASMPKDDPHAAGITEPDCAAANPCDEGYENIADFLRRRVTN